MNSNKPWILVVEDDKNISETLSIILQKNGYETETAQNGRTAIQKIKTKFFNIALLDIKLPDMEGTELLASIQDYTPDMVKIMITGHPSLGNAVKALNLGADAYIIKPVKPSELLALIKEKLELQIKAGIITEEKVTEWIKTRARQLTREDRMSS